MAETAPPPGTLKEGMKVNVIGKPNFGIGTVKFVGETQFQAGTWVGIELPVTCTFITNNLYYVVHFWMFIYSIVDI